MDKTNLVILKTSNELILGSDVLYPNTYYRCLDEEKNGEKSYYVYGINMHESLFNEYFEYAYDRIMRDWERIGLIQNDKLISKTAFKKLANVHIYGKQTNNIRIIFFGIPNECLYGFYPLYSENKAKQLDAMYKWCIQVMDGYMGYFDQQNIQFGNRGIPIGYGDLRVW